MGSTHMAQEAGMAPTFELGGIRLPRPVPPQLTESTLVRTCRGLKPLGVLLWVANGAEGCAIVDCIGIEAKRPALEGPGKNLIDDSRSGRCCMRILHECTHTPKVQRHMPNGRYRAPEES